MQPRNSRDLFVMNNIRGNSDFIKIFMIHDSPKRNRFVCDATNLFVGTFSMQFLATF